jgi:CheY-like chemotaxis protein
LAKLGYRADVVGNGREALTALEQERYDVVLWTSRCPSSTDSTDRIASAGRRRRPRVGAMTANAMQEDREACFAAGMDDYVAKPIRPEALAEALRQVHPLTSA